MEMGKKIRQLRFKAGLTQDQLAERLGVAPQSVSKWENAAAMPDITTLPLLAEIFGVTIDDLFDLTTEQRLNRIENRMDAEEELPADVFREFEGFLQAELKDEKNKDRATGLIAYLYWHRMNAEARKASRYAKEAITRNPAKKDCQWILSYTDNHAVWDWNMANHAKAVDFYRELAEQNPDAVMPCSSTDQGTRPADIASTTARAVAKTSDIWLGPSPTSRPKTVTPTTIIPIRAANGKKAMKMRPAVNFAFSSTFMNRPPQNSIMPDAQTVSCFR